MVLLQNERAIIKDMKILININELQQLDHYILANCMHYRIAKTILTFA